jgi:VanZ family protein
VLGAMLAATATTGAGRSVVIFQLGPVHAYFAQLADPGRLWTDLRGFGQTAERVANIGLYLPLGLLATLIWRRPGWSIAGAAALSFAIELWQAVIGRGGDLNDVLHNAAGAALGAFVARQYLASQGTV